MTAIGTLFTSMVGGVIGFFIGHYLDKIFICIYNKIHEKRILYKTPKKKFGNYGNCTLWASANKKWEEDLLKLMKKEDKEIFEAATGLSSISPPSHKEPDGDED